MNEIEEAVKLFGREDLLNNYGIQDTDENIEVFMSVKDMVKYYKRDKEIERLNNIINEYENKGYDIGQERADFLLEIQRLNNIINELSDFVIKIYQQELDKTGDWWLQEELKTKFDDINLATNFRLDKELKKKQMADEEYLRLYEEYCKRHPEEITNNFILEEDGNEDYIDEIVEENNGK